ncbi:MAG: LON peptidase substrate-binding domain-containing protein [Acidobacteriota bacterium]
MNFPQHLPIFPLTGSLLLPEGLLPLHIFEPRYRNLVEDVLASHQFMGMVQPRVPTPADMRGLGEDVEGPPALYEIGCVGQIEQHQSLPFGRFLVVLRGVCRFKTVEELPPERGYRRVVPDYAPFAGDLEDQDGDLEVGSLIEALERFSQLRGVEVELDRLAEVPPVALLNGLAMSLPLAPAEKQALLEAEDVGTRHAMLLTLLEMGLASDEDGGLTH